MEYFVCLHVNVAVKKASAEIRLSNCVQTYDGSPKRVTVTTEPEGIPYIIKYYQGTYEVTDTQNADVYYVEVIVNTNAYEAVANTWLIVNKVPQIIVWNQEQTLEEGKELMLTASNSSSMQEIEYHSETPSVADIYIRNGKAYLVGKSKGTVRVMARINGDNNHEEAAEVRTFVVQAPTSIHEIAPENISCYPTQINDCLYIEGTYAGDHLILMSMNGNKIINLIARNNLEKIDFNNLSSGIYLLKIIRNNESYTHKVMKR